MLAPASRIPGPARPVRVQGSPGWHRLSLDTISVSGTARTSLPPAGMSARPKVLVLQSRSPGCCAAGVQSSAELLAGRPRRPGPDTVLMNSPRRCPRAAPQPRRDGPDRTTSGFRTSHNRLGQKKEKKKIKHGSAAGAVNSPSLAISTVFFSTVGPLLLRATWLSRAVEDKPSGPACCNSSICWYRGGAVRRGEQGRKP